MRLAVKASQGVGMERLKTTIASSAIAMALLCAVGSNAVLSQGLNQVLAAQAKPTTGEDRLLVDAKEIIYNNDKNTIAASGDVQLNYQGRSLQADRVIYDRNTGRVYAEGHAKLTDEKGAVLNADRFELTDDFKSGFINSLRLVQTSVDDGRSVTTRFSAPRAERAAGETTTFERGTYTACEPCKDHPEKPPLWQVKAAKIIHNASEQTIYYEDATMEVFGFPVAYLPYFWTPDPTVKRKTGFLAPGYVISNSLGFGASVPFFWAIAPNYDLTLNPTFLSRQGVLGEVEWRHRLETGAYNIRATGIMQGDSSAFLKSPYGAGDRDNRGSLKSTGLFYINERWKWGWDVALLSDKWFLQNYSIKSESLATNYIRGVDLHPLSPGSGRPIVLRCSRLLFPGPLHDRLAKAAAHRPSGSGLQQAHHSGEHRRRTRHRRERDEPVACGGAIPTDPDPEQVAVRIVWNLHGFRSGHMPRARRERHELEGLRERVLAS